MGATDKRGLGKGLDEIIRDSSVGAQPLVSSEGQFLASLVNAGLLLVDNAADLSHVAYLHVADGAEPELFQRRPHLDSVDPTSLYRLYRLIGMASDGPDEIGQVVHDGTDLRFLRTKGERSVGVHIFGTAGEPFTDEQVVDLLEISHMSATVLHQYQAGAPAPPSVPELRIEADGDRFNVTAESGGKASNGHTGTAVADTVEIATATAVLDAFDRDYEVADVQVAELEPRQAALVILRGPEGRLKLGLVIGNEASPHLVAAATMRAMA